MLKYKIPQIVTLILKKDGPEKEEGEKCMGIKKGVPLYSNLC